MSAAATFPLTIVTPAYNSARSITNAVRSGFLAGAERVIVVDDGSTDDTAAVAEAAGADVIQQENAGASAARSNGASRVETEFVTFLDADDELLPTGVKASVQRLRADDTLAVVAGRVIGFVGDDAGSLLPQTYTDVNTASLLEIGYGPWPPGAAVQRTSALREAESVDPKPLRPRFAEDYELLIRLSMVGGIERHDEPAMRYEMAGGKSARSAGSALASKEAIREHYARALGMSIELMAPRRMKAAAHKRVARAKSLSGDVWGSRKHMLAAYLQGGLSLLERKRRTE